MSSLADFICASDPFCGSIEVEVKDLKISNMVVHGPVGCGVIVREGAVAAGALKKVNEEVDVIRRSKTCEKNCACTSILITEFDIAHSRNVVREPAVGPCSVSFDLSFKLGIKIYGGICHNPDFTGIEDCLQDWKDLWEKIKAFIEQLKKTFDPDEIWKKIGGTSPKALRESESMEPPRRIRRRRKPSPDKEQPDTTPNDSEGPKKPSAKTVEEIGHYLLNHNMSYHLNYVETTDESLVGTVLGTHLEGDHMEVNLAVAPLTLRSLQEVDVAREKHMQDGGIADFYAFTEMDLTNVKIKTVGKERLQLWQFMSHWIKQVPFIDGNAAELLVRGLGLKSPADTTEWASAFLSKNDAEAAILEAGKNVKLPKDYVENNLSTIALAIMETNKV